MKKVALIVVPLLILGLGAVAVLGRIGILKIPGLTPAKKKNVAARQYGEVKDEKPLATAKPAADTRKPKMKPKVEVAANDPAVARRKLAKVWAEMEPSSLVAMVKTWKVDELTDVFLAMDASKVSEILSEMDANRADAVSRAILKRAGK